jgi:hypothetical protein
MCGKLAWIIGLAPVSNLPSSSIQLSPLSYLPSIYSNVWNTFQNIYIYIYIILSIPSSHLVCLMASYF